MTWFKPSLAGRAGHGQESPWVIRTLALHFPFIPQTPLEQNATRTLNSSKYKVSMVQDNILREDLYFLLGSTGAILPPATKIPDDGIKKRIIQAFDTSQETAILFGATPIDTAELPPWTSSKTIYAATRRGSLMEKFTGTMPKKGAHSAQWETFQEMRQTLDCIAFGIDSRVRDFLLVGPQNEWAVFVRVRVLH